MSEEPCHRFVPSRVDGLPDVTEVLVRPDRLEVLSAGQWLVFPFEDLAEWPRPAWLWRLVSRLGFRPRWLPVAERDWFHRPPERFFKFFTRPRVVVYMPADEPAEHRLSNFWRVQQVIMAGGFNSYDLG